MPKEKDSPLLDPGFVREIVGLVNSGAKIIQIRTHERERVRDLAVALLHHPQAKHELKKTFTWSLSLPAFNNQTLKFTKSSDDVIEPFEQLKEAIDANPGIWVLEDYHHLLTEKIEGIFASKAIDFLANKSEYDDTVILLGGIGFDVPPELTKAVSTIDLPLPDGRILRHIADEETGLKGKMISAEAIEAARGLTLVEARQAFLRAFQAIGNLCDKQAVQTVSAFKGSAIKQSRLLEYFDTQGFEMGDVGGMENVKKWLEKRKVGLLPNARELRLDPPKGVLLLGVQGCGKSLLAKTVAYEWNLPLLRFDLGKVMSMWLGQSEGNIREALNLADAMAPCVLWIDEIEKGIPKSSPFDEGTGLRVLGTILTWMQEKKQTVFVVATANSVNELPPELLRKGRFDEIFFVDLPDQAARAKIYDIHTRKRGQALSPEVLQELAAATHGFSGAEIESSVSEALYNWAFEREQDLTDVKFETRHILQAIKETRPLSVLMSEKIKELREWSRTRARPAAAPEA
jgi:AAA+ superfamily predicted ATPase